MEKGLEEIGATLSPGGKVYTSDTISREKKEFSLKFLMWVLVVSIIMVFAGLTSAMMVSMKDNVANNSWKTFSMPLTFTWSTIAIVLSSIALYWSQMAAKKNNYAHVNYGLWGALLLGFVFITSQCIGFSDLYDMGVRFIDNSAKTGDKVEVNNASGSFFMVLTGMHGLHVLAGIIVLAVMMVKALKYRINSENNLNINLTGIFWHSLGMIWVYLFIFLSVIFN